MMIVWCGLILCFQCSNRGKALAVETDHGSRKRKEVPRRSRGSSSSGGFDRDKFIDRDHDEQYRVIDNWRFISERRVELRDGECPEFTQMLTRRNWWPLASLPEKFDLDIVKEFYANAYGGKDSKSREKVSVVRGTRVPYTLDQRENWKLGYFSYLFLSKKWGCVGRFYLNEEPRRTWLGVHFG